MKPLSGLDAAFLYLESAGTPMHVGSVMLVEPSNRRGYDFRSALLAHLAERLPRAPVLSRLLHEAPFGLGHPMWGNASELDLRRHVVARRLPGAGGQAKLMALVGKLHAIALPRDRPMWQFVVIENVEPGVIALYSKIHHALLDGQGGAALAQAILDIEPGTRRKKAATAVAASSIPPARSELARLATHSTVTQFARLLRAVPATLRLARDAASGSGVLGALRDNVLMAPRSVFNRKVGPKRTFAAISLPIDTVKRVAKGFDASVNDVVMAICAGALRDLLLKADALPRKSLVAAMPVSLRQAGNAEVNNQVSMVQCSLATDIADPVERLHAIRASTAQIKQRVATFKHMIPTDFPGFAAPIWASGLSRLWAHGRVAERLPALANVAISNVPGPPVPLYLAGSRLRNYYPASIVTHGLAFNITVQSYAGSLEFGLTACKDAVARPDTVARAMATSLDELVQRLP